MTTETFYPKTDALLYSMALRCDHGFGMYSKEEQDKIVERMSQWYDAYVAGKTNEEMDQEFNSCLITLSQVREEVNGTGFFQPTEQAEQFYQSFKK